MEVILLEKVANFGGLGDKINVKSGFARNFLIPSGKAKPATPANIEEFEARRAELEKVASDTLTAAEARKAAVDALGPITIKANAGNEGKLFGSIGTHDIVEAVAAAGVPIEKKEVRLPQGALREVGEYNIDLHFHIDVDVKIQLLIEAEE